MSSLRATVAGHGAYAEGMLSAVHQIAGRDDVFALMTNRDLSAQDVEEQLRRQLAETGIRVVFTDLPAGSCTMAARRLQREIPDLVVVTGANLATLLDFAFRDDESPAEAARHAAEKGRAALVVTGGGQ
jgi:PTS system N-acetylgalactosamine-specific IIA component